MNEYVRAEAVSKPTDQNVLIDIARNDNNRNVREVAVFKLTDQKVLADIAQNDKDKYVREAAANKMTNQGESFRIINESSLRDILME